MDRFLKQLVKQLEAVVSDSDEIFVTPTRHDQDKNVYVCEVKYRNCYFAIYSQQDNDRLLNVIFWRDKS